MELGKRWQFLLGMEPKFGPLKKAENPLVEKKVTISKANSFFVTVSEFLSI